jgi:HEAT repeat protein
MVAPATRDQAGEDEAQRLREQLADSAPETRAIGLATVIQQPAFEFTNDLARLVDDEDANIAHLATIALGRIGEDALTELITALDSRQKANIRTAAASAIAEIGPAGAPAVTPLRVCLESDDDTLREVTSIALTRIGSAAVDVLRDTLASPSLRTRLTAAATVGRIGQDAEPATERLREIRDDAELQMKLAAASALVAITGNTGEGLPTLVEATHDEDSAMRADAARLIGDLGERGRPAVSRLIELLDDAEAEVAAAAALALARLRSTDSRVIEALTRALEREDASVRRNVEIALATLDAR